MGFTKLEFPISDPIWGIGTPCPKNFRDREHWWGVSSLNWMKNMGIGIGNTTGGDALRGRKTTLELPVKCEDFQSAM